MDSVNKHNHCRVHKSMVKRLVLVQKTETIDGALSQHGRAAIVIPHCLLQRGPCRFPELLASKSPQLAPSDIAIHAKLHRYHIRYH